MPTKYLILPRTIRSNASFAFSSPRAWGASTSGPTDLAIQIDDGHETDEGFPAC